VSERRSSRERERLLWEEDKRIREEEEARREARERRGEELWKAWRERRLQKSRVRLWPNRKVEREQ
jgi:hypothetical protein